MEYNFYHVDVFTTRRFGGNSLAVFPEAAGLGEELMQSLANEMNLSETTFVFPSNDPTDAASIRIFTPSRELPFAGHPTIGTAFVLACLGRISSPSFSFEERVGRIPITIEGPVKDPDVIWMQQPLPKFGHPLGNRSEIAESLTLREDDLLNTPIVVGSAGVPFLYVGLKTAEAVDRARLVSLRFESLSDLEGAQGVFLFALKGGGGVQRVHSRMFGSEKLGIVEDPATGGASGPLGAYLVENGLVPPASHVQVISDQGVKMGRPAEVLIDLTMAEGTVTEVRVGGRVVSVFQGVVQIP